jgi:hypothetical protein
VGHLVWPPLGVDHAKPTISLQIFPQSVGPLTGAKPSNRAVHVVNGDDSRGLLPELFPFLPHRKLTVVAVDQNKVEGRAIPQHLPPRAAVEYPPPFDASKRTFARGDVAEVGVRHLGVEER